MLLRLLLSVAVVAFSEKVPSKENSLMRVISKILDASNCPGLVLDLDDWTEEVISDQLVNYGRPFTLFSDSFTDDKEILCNDVVVSRQDATDFLPFYRRLQSVYNLNQVIVMTQTIDEVINRTLEAIGSDRIFVLSSSQLLRWSAGNQKTFKSPLDSFQIGTNSTAKFSGRHLRVATLHYPPAVVVRHLENGRTVLDGIEPSIMNLIAAQLNFTFDHVLAATDEMWGEILTSPDGQQSVRFTGIRGMLARREVDVAFGDLYMNPSWLPHLSFSQVYKTDFDCFAVPAPRPSLLADSWTVLIMPFALETWMATLSALVLVSAVLGLSGNRKTCFLFALGQLLWVQQPRSGGNGSSTGRLFLITFWLFAATVIPTVYRSGLISFLTRPSAQPPVDTIQQLVESPLKKMMFTDFYRPVLLNSSDFYRRQLGRQLTTTHNMSHMFSLLDTGEWAVDSSLDTLRHVIGSSRSFHLMKERLFPTRSSFGLQKDSALKAETDRAIQRLIEAGLVEYHRRLPGMKLDERKHHQLVRFSLGNLQSAFYLLAVGLLLSTVAFIAESVSKGLL